MDIYRIRQELKSKSIFDLPLRVTYYARVSTDSEEQLNSLENQVSYYPNYILSHSNWTLVDGYVDEGISGISTKGRERFLEMIDDAKHDKFDMIITKEISRFARNTVDSIKYTRDLLNMGVCVFFQNDGINTIDEDSELRLTIMSGIAQDELRKLSSRVRWGHQQAIKNNVVLGNSRIFGYTKKNKHLVIDEAEAEMVRLVFQLYATDQYSMKAIEKVLWDRGYRNHNGNKISHTTLSSMIANPKYKGYYVGNKVKIVDLFTKKQKFLPPEEWVMFKDETGDIVPAIVTEEVWDAANEVLSRRSMDVKQKQNKYNHANLLTGKLICAHCGRPYYRKDSSYRGTNKSKWVCSGKSANGAASCPSFTIDEQDIQQVLFDVFTSTRDASAKYIDEYIKLYKSVAVPDYQKQSEALSATVERAKAKKQKLLTLYVDGTITKDDFKAMNDQCTKELEDAQQQLAAMDNAMHEQQDLANDLELLRRRLNEAAAEASQSGTISIAFINKYIDSILVTPVSKDTMRLNIKIFSGSRIEQQLCRTGHMSKNICPERLSHFTRECRRLPGHTAHYIYLASLSIN